MAAKSAAVAAYAEGRYTGKPLHHLHRSVRSVEAMQRGRDGGALFVIAAEGGSASRVGSCDLPRAEVCEGRLHRASGIELHTRSGANVSNASQADRREHARTQGVGPASCPSVPDAASLDQRKINPVSRGSRSFPQAAYQAGQRRAGRQPAGQGSGPQRRPCSPPFRQPRHRPQHQHKPHDHAGVHAVVGCLRHRGREGKRRSAATSSVIQSSRWPSVSVRLPFNAGSSCPPGAVYQYKREESQLAQLECEDHRLPRRMKASTGCAANTWTRSMNMRTKAS